MSTESGSAAALVITEAQKAYDAGDSRAFALAIEQALSIDSESPQAWDLRAKFGGWDSKMLELNLEQALRDIAHALDLVPESRRYDAASEIYVARKKQVAEQLEAAMMMPSYMGAKNLHAIMMDWKRLLVEMPYLTPGLIEGEITLCDNLCLRSKMGVMPNDRLVYTAYATFNKKEPYGETFRKALTSRIDRERVEAMGQLAALQERLDTRQSERHAARVSGELSPEEERSQIERDIAELNEALQTLEGLSDLALYQSQITEMERTLASLKLYKVFKRRELEGQIAALRLQVEEASAQLAESKAPLEARIDALRGCIEEIGRGE